MPRGLQNKKTGSCVVSAVGRSLQECSQWAGAKQCSSFGSDMTGTATLVWGWKLSWRAWCKNRPWVSKRPGFPPRAPEGKSSMLPTMALSVWQIFVCPTPNTLPRLACSVHECSSHKSAAFHLGNQKSNLFASHPEAKNAKSREIRHGVRVEKAMHKSGNRSSPRTEHWRTVETVWLHKTKNTNKQQRITAKYQVISHTRCSYVQSLQRQSCSGTAYISKLNLQHPHVPLKLSALQLQFPQDPRAGR